MDAAGVKAGLCLHLGAGRAETPGLTAALAECGGMPVHGLALDDASLTRARSAIDSRGLAGRAMVEKVPGKSLPYLLDMAKLAVVEDLASLTAAGISREDILRVVAPGGALCVNEGGRWVATIKPRPKDMDEWTHPHHGADGNLASADKAVSFPLGLRWIDGLPVTLSAYASCRSLVLAGGRCFTVSVNDLANINARTLNVYLQARDAYSGMPLWKFSCETTYDGRSAVDWRNDWPLVATDRRVYTTKKSQLVILDAATGQVEATCATKHMPTRLLLLDGLVVTSTWEGAEQSKDGYDGGLLRRQLWPTGAGSVEAFDAVTGAAKWSLPFAAYEMVASGGTLYLMTHKGNPPTEREVVAVELATGKEKWRVPHTVFDAEPGIYLSVAGPGCVVVSKFKGKPEVSVLSEKDGAVLFNIPGNDAPCIVNGELWCSSGRFDLKAGKNLPGAGIGLHYGSTGGVGGCVPTIIIGDRYVGFSRKGVYTDVTTSPPTKHSYQGVRAACMLGMVPANGMLYTAQNYCGCYPAQPYGFIAAGSCGELPKAEDFARPRPVETGPAAGAAGAVEPIPSADDWPTYRHDAGRGAGIATTLPDALRMLWKVPCAKPGEGQFAEAWNSRIGLPQPLTAPVVAAGRVFIAGLNSGQVMALDAVTGATLWKTLLGSRVDSPPTYYKGFCLVGCHDGWVYALRARDGALAYRVRVAPLERRMAAYGLVESVWPATGAVLVHDGIAYVTAGRSTQTDGGVALVAFKPETGETLWTRAIDASLWPSGDHPGLLQDILSVRDGELAWHELRMDPKTGKPLPPAARGGATPMLDGAWTAGFFMRVGSAFTLGRANASMMAWNDTLAVSPIFAVSREKTVLPKPQPNSPPKRPEPFKADELAWRPNLEPINVLARVHAMALSGNAAFFAGVVGHGYQSEKYEGSFLWIKSMTDGTTRQPTIKLDALPCYDSLAIAGGRVYLSLQSGDLVCWGK